MTGQLRGQEVNNAPPLLTTASQTLVSTDVTTAACQVQIFSFTFVQLQKVETPHIDNMWHSFFELMVIKH